MRRYLNITLIVLSLSLAVLADENKNIQIGEFKGASIKFASQKNVLKLQMKNLTVNNEGIIVNYESDFGGCKVNYTIDLKKTDKNYAALSVKLHFAKTANQPINLSPATIWNIKKIVKINNQANSEVSMTLNSIENKTIYMKCELKGLVENSSPKLGLLTYIKLLAAGIRLEKNGKEYKPYKEELAGMSSKVVEHALGKPVKRDGISVWFHQ